MQGEAKILPARSADRKWEEAMKVMGDAARSAVLVARHQADVDSEEVGLGERRGREELGTEEGSEVDLRFLDLVLGSPLKRRAETMVYR